MRRDRRKVTLWLVLGLSGSLLQAAEREGAFDGYRFAFEQRNASKKRSERGVRKPEPERKPGPEAAGEEQGDSRGTQSAGDDEAQQPDPAEIVYHDEAVPPPGVMVERATDAEAAVPVGFGAARGVNLAGQGITRATFGRNPVQPGLGHVGAGLAGVEGRFTYSLAGERRPIPIYVQFGFVTVIEFRNGEHPTGGAFCGLCGKSGAFDVQALSNRVGIKPREMSSGEGGTLATNLTIITDQDATYTFNVVEISGLGLVRTDRHEVRAATADGGSIVGFTFEDRLEAARETLAAATEAKLESARRSIVTEKAAEKMETRYKFKRGRGRMEIQSVATIGDETVVKLIVPKGSYNDPVAVVERGRRKRHRISVVSRRSTEIQPHGDNLEVTISLDAVELYDNERLRITLVDTATGEELQASIEAV